MMRIDVICVGKLKESFWKDACGEYIKRLGGYAKISMTELPETPVAQPSEISAALARECKMIEARIAQGAYVVCMCVEGVRMKSEALAECVSKLALGGVSRLCFIIGGSNGLDDAIKNRAGLRLSMSDMTFPHHLARVMLLEQLYRAFKINEGSEYHK